MSIDFFSQYTMTSGGKAVDTELRLEVVNPATEEAIASIPCANKDHVDAAVAAARAAFPAWAAQPMDARKELMAAFAERMALHADELAALLTREQGKPLAAAKEEVIGGIHWARHFSTMSLPVALIDTIPGQQISVRSVPLGVVGGIVPWNFPILLALWKIAPALVAGNTLVIKPSPFTPLTLLKLGELARDLFPAGVFNVICGGDDVGPWMTSHPGIDKISFTGSTATGRKVMESGAGNLKRLTLELGGNDAAIVMPDVDIRTVVEPLFWSAFFNCGQICVAAKRMYIHEDIYDELSQALAEYAKSVRIGNGAEEGVTLGPIQNHHQFARLKRMLSEARESNLRFLAGGQMPEAGKGYFFPVTIVDNPPDDAKVVTEEAFGPILPLLKFKTIDEVVARANNAEYGLGGTIWAKDTDYAQSVAVRLQTGTVWINQAFAVFPEAAFGGHKQSGIGIENGLDGLREYTNTQTITLKTA